MHDLGHTRSARRRDHLLQTPDTFVRTPMDGLTNGSAIVHMGPAGGANFTQYTIELDVGGSLAGGGFQSLIYVLEGEVRLSVPGRDELFDPGSYAYLPPALGYRISASRQARVAVIERVASGKPGVPEAALLISHEDAVSSSPLLGDNAVQVRTLLPAEMCVNFAVNTMTYQPGASLSMTEIHVMEHGLLMLEGGGIYRLGSDWYPVSAGDFIWMAPFCPQWFGALGREPAKYLIYKDCNQHPLL